MIAPPAAIDQLDGLGDILAAALDVVVGADAHGGDSLLAAHNVFHGVHEFFGQLAVGNQN